MMKALFLLIALYTITGKEAVADGTVPPGSSCTYVQSGTKSGQMTAGNTIDLVLTGYDGATISSVTLMMRSNSSAGAGSMQLQVGEQTVWQIADAAFNTASWYGAYSSDFVPIENTFTNLVVPDGGAISLHMAASVNSLYLQSVQINYTIPAAQPCTVSFDTHTNLRVSPVTEQTAGAGVILPEFQIYDADWQFYGWADNPLIETTTKPLSVYPAQSLYHPSTDCTLHAVYKHTGEEPVWLAADSIGTDTYILAAYAPELFADHVLRAAGAVADGHLLLQPGAAIVEGDEVVLPTTVYGAEEVYTVTRSSDTTVTIRHTATSKYVTLGKSSNFTTSSTATRHWQITPYDAADAPRGAYSLSQQLDGTTYYVGVDFQASEYVFYLKPTTAVTNVKPLLLYSTTNIEREPSAYTSYINGEGVEQTTADGQNMTDYTLDLGTYTIHIHNGKKTLQLK